MDSATGDEMSSGLAAFDPQRPPCERTVADNEEELPAATASLEDEADEELLDAAADFIGLVRDDDVQTLQLGVDRFGVETARVACCAVERRLGGLTAFTLAAELGHRDIIELFVGLGADVNSKNATGGWTPLHCAVSQGFIEVRCHYEYYRQLVDWLFKPALAN